MEMFYAFCVWTFLTCSGAFAMGHVMASVDIVRDCGDGGEIVVKGRVIQCDISHTIINGRRVALDK